MPDPSEVHDVYTLGAFCFAAVLAVASRFLFRWIDPRNKPDDAQELRMPTSGDTPDAQINVRGMSPEIVSALTKVSGSLASVMEQNASLDARVNKLEKTQDDLVKHVVILRKGIANGTIPPLPDLAETIKHLFGDLLD